MQHDYNGFPHQNNARSIVAANPRNARIIRHADRDLLMPIFDTERAIRLTPNLDASRVIMPSDSPITRDIDTPFNVARYTDARTPISLGTIDEATRRAFVRTLPVWAQHVLDMPIQFPDTDVRLPRVLESFAPALQRILDVEAQVNPRSREYYAYLSIHQASLASGERMRENPYHVDGFQGPRWTTKQPVNHSYLLCDRLPTVFYPRGFPLGHLDLEMDDIYAEFGRQIEGDANTPSWRPGDFELILMDAYCVHRGDIADKPMVRTWMRVSWETRVFDRIGNTHNPLFDYDWQMVARDTNLRVRPAAELSVAA